ncbi:hypothetical protein GUITHDRAFT_148779 [Guillardia theta CCMP2712]|uniref:Uncharacterized protein n=1 Tax=Guillardia theta (strain CCMP2712) TaxID=905079 RepID=L1I8M1_GUITC|nr:hypothetical protein GUITHDRAFT_148779 [Guillardia theta CCMP2712]EKX32195.1 hypothetical protein GUITHDRAFT_148779 [Guillardia theta CCMP2712]|eukprot:XP_005819175.1 hypothetical protein GUITHDRAFT_148779 [Guillardia theta CCMP2712]
MSSTQMTVYGKDNVLSLFHHLSTQEVFLHMSIIFFPFRGIAHGDVMGFRYSNFKGKPLRRQPITDLYEFIRKNDICSIHLGGELDPAVRGTQITYTLRHRMFVIDIDTQTLDPQVHLLMVSFIAANVYQSFIRESTKDMQQILVCCSGKGWHIYFAFRQLYWSVQSEDWQRDLERDLRKSIMRFVNPVPILSARSPSDSYITFARQDYAWRNETLEGTEGTVWIPYWYREWYAIIEPRFVDACTNHTQWLSQYGPIKSVLHQMCCFVDGMEKKFMLHLFQSVSTMTSIKDIFRWVQSMREKVSWFQADCMFKTPELVKVSIAYACIELECRKTGFFIDMGLADPTHMLRAPFSPKIWDNGDDGFISLPLGDPYTALSATNCTMRVSEFTPDAIAPNVAHFKNWYNHSMPKIIPREPMPANKKGSLAGLSSRKLFMGKTIKITLSVAMVMEYNQLTWPPGMHVIEIDNLMMVYGPGYVAYATSGDAMDFFEYLADYVNNPENPPQYPHRHNLEIHYKVVQGTIPLYVFHRLERFRMHGSQVTSWDNLVNTHALRTQVHQTIQNAPDFLHHMARAHRSHSLILAEIYRIMQGLTPQSPIPDVNDDFRELCANHRRLYHSIFLLFAMDLLE